MSIRPGNLGSVLIDTGVGAVASETYNPQTKTEYGTGGSTGTRLWRVPMKPQTLSHHRKLLPLQ